MPDQRQTRATHRPALIAAAIAAAVLALFILTPLNNTRADFDQRTFHLPTILELARQLPPGAPPLDLTNIRTATTPGYHLTVAALANLTTNTTLLRLAAALFTIAAVALTAKALAARLAPADPWRTATAVALTAPLIVNLYLVASGAWLLPDNAAWLCAIAALIALDRQRLTPATLAIAATAATLAVATRQTHIWTVALLYAALWLNAAPTPNDNNALRFLTTAPAARLRALAIAAALSLPAWGLLAYFFNLWHGLVPPNFDTLAANPDTGQSLPKNTGTSPTMPLITLALTAVYAPFLLVTLHQPLLAKLRAHPRAFLITTITPALAVAILAAIPDTTYSIDQGKYSGLWNLTRQLEVAHTSPPLIALAAAGAAALALFAQLLPPRQRILYAVAIAAPTAAHCFTANAWARYIDAILIVTLAAATATALTHHNAKPRLTLVGPAALALLHAAITASKITTG